MSKLAAGIVTHNPDTKLLRSVISAISGQVNMVFIVDNASREYQCIELLASDYPTVRLVRNERNLGIGAALNQILDLAAAAGSEWVLTLDQDSIAPGGLVKHLDSLAKEGVGIVCPRIVDRNFSLSRGTGSGATYVPECITSGALTSVQAWRSVGGFDRDMFIDYVDFEFCLRLRQRGYSIIQSRDIALSHQLGDSKVVRLFGRDFVAYQHVPLRRYYFARNVVYCARKHPSHMSAARAFLILLQRTIITLWLEDQRWEKAIAAMRGVRDGLSMDTSPSRRPSDLTVSDTPWR